MSTLTPESLATLLVDAAEDKKAWDPVVIDLRGMTTVADYFVICDGETDRQLRAIADAMLEQARERGVRPQARSVSRQRPVSRMSVIWTGERWDRRSRAYRTRLRRPCLASAP